MKQTMKKPLSLFVAFLMIVTTCISTFPLTAFATTSETQTDDMYFKIEVDSNGDNTVERTFYADTLKNALSEVTEAAEKVTVTQIKDYNGNSTDFYTDSTKIKNLIIDGGENKYISSQSGYAKFTSTANLTIQNYAELVPGKGLVVTQLVDVTMNNIVFKNGSGGSASTFIYEPAASGTKTITIKDTTISNNKGETVVKFGKSTSKHEITVNVINSVIQTVDAVGGSGSNGAVVGFLGGTTIFNLDGTSQVVVANTAAVAVGKKIFHALNSSKITLNLASESKLIHQGNTSKVFVTHNQSGSPTWTVNDNGCKYIISKDAAQGSVLNLPTLNTVGENGKLIAFSAADGSGLYKGTYTNTAGKDVTLTAVGYGTSTFEMVDGASTRTESPYGIRFTATVDESFYAQLLAADANAEFGIVLGPKKYIGSAEFFNKLGAQSESQYAKLICTDKMTVDSQYAGKKVFRSAVYINGNGELTSATKEQFEAKMTANAYFTYHLADGTGTAITVWADWNGDDNSRSIYDVALAHYEAGYTENDTINNVLTVCGYFDAQ